MRKLPEIDPPDSLTHRELGIIEQERKYRLLTPLYGGGVVAGEADPVTVVRATEIRGLLRFWWRATQGGLAQGNMKQLNTLEAAIWGEAHNQEEETEEQEHEETLLQLPVQIEVVVLDSGRGQPKKPFIIEGDGRFKKARPTKDVPDYAAFPLRPPNDDLSRKDKPQLEEDMKNLLHGVSFTLKITFAKEHKEAIEAALWAWETFGGIGARTRRGFGALQLLRVIEKENSKQLLQVNEQDNTNLPPSNRPGEVRRWLNDNLRRFVVAGSWPQGVPHLERTLNFQITSRPGATESDSWRDLIWRYKSFRQSRSKGNTGRSNWPEAEAIRDLVGPDPHYYLPLGHPQKFPRAAFGLPIIFHFKDEQKGDSPETTLQGAEEGHERFASPLILRPLACKGGVFVGLAAVLQGSDLPPLALKGREGTVEAQLTKDDLTKLPNLNVNNQTDVLQAFLDSLRG
jgi:CRISPR-associated protein Cmr1